MTALRSLVTSGALVTMLGDGQVQALQLKRLGQKRTANAPSTGRLLPVSPLSGNQSKPFSPLAAVSGDEVDDLSELDFSHDDIEQLKAGEDLIDSVELTDQEAALFQERIHEGQFSSDDLQAIDTNVLNNIYGVLTADQMQEKERLEKERRELLVEKYNALCRGLYANKPLSRRRRTNGSEMDSMRIASRSARLQLAAAAQGRKLIEGVEIHPHWVQSQIDDILKRAGIDPGVYTIPVERIMPSGVIFARAGPYGKYVLRLISEEEGLKPTRLNFEEHSSSSGGGPERLRRSARLAARRSAPY